MRDRYNPLGPLQFDGDAVGSFLKSAREEGGYAGVSEFLDALRLRGIPLARTVVYDSESGRRRPTLATLRAYAEVLGRPDLMSVRVDDDDLLSSNTIGDLGEEDDWPSGAVIGRLIKPDVWLDTNEFDYLHDVAGRDLPSTPTTARGKRAVTALVQVVLARGAIFCMDDHFQGEREVYVYDAGSSGCFPGDITSSDWNGLTALALKAGLDIVHIRNRFESPLERRQFAGDLRALLGYRGRYLPHLLAPGTDAPAPFGIVSVPMVGTVQLLAADDPRKCDVAIFFPWDLQGELEFAENALRRHVQLLSDRAQPIVRRFDAAEPIGEPELRQNDYWWVRARAERALLDLERQPGTRYLFKDGLSTTTCPASIVRSRINRILPDRGADDQVASPSLAMARELVEVRSDRHREFLRSLNTFQTVDFATKRSLQSYCENGVFSDVVDDYWGAPATPSEVSEHLRFVIDLLLDEPMYHLLLIDDEQLESLAPPGTSMSGAGWMLKAKKKRAECVIVEVVKNEMPNSARSVHTVFEIRHPEALRSILSDFESIRAGFGDLQSEREATIDYLNKLVLHVDEGIL